MTVLALRNGQYIVYRQWPTHRALITPDQRSTIFDPPLTPILKKVIGACSYLFSLYRRPILWLYIGTTISPLNYLTCKTKYCWCSIDAQFQNGAGSVWLALLPIKPANAALMNRLNRLPRRLPMIQDEKSLTLRWRSFCNGRIHNMISFDLACYIINGVVAAFVPSSCTFSFITTLFFNNTYKYIL